MKDPRIDLYISKSADFAKPVLNHLRQLVHNACPQVEETIKWGFPHFDYKGMMCSMASFKHHCAFTFWKAALMKDKSLLKNAISEVAMGHFGRITSLKDLPPDKKIIGYIKEAMKLNDEGVKLPTKSQSKSAALIVPDYFIKALKKRAIAFKNFNSLSPSHRKEHIQWITEARTEETRNRRLQASIEMIAEGKSRMWKYQKKK
jgi:uncharacterized protein YdeI (YjbR/CyaY-like superfamily)